MSKLNVTSRHYGPAAIAPDPVLGEIERREERNSAPHTGFGQVTVRAQIHAMTVLPSARGIEVSNASLRLVRIHSPYARTSAASPAALPRGRSGHLPSQETRGGGRRNLGGISTAPC